MKTVFIQNILWRRWPPKNIALSLRASPGKDQRATGKS
jgi:hypothetical protein